MDEARPLSAGVEISRQVFHGGNGDVVRAVDGISGELDTEQAARLGAGDTFEALVGAGGPKTLGVDGLDDLGIIDGHGTVVLHGNGAGNSEQNKKSNDDAHLGFEQSKRREYSLFSMSRQHRGSNQLCRAAGCRSKQSERALHRRTTGAPLQPRALATCTRRVTLGLLPVTKRATTLSISFFQPF